MLSTCYSGLFQQKTYGWAGRQSIFFWMGCGILGEFIFMGGGDVGKYISMGGCPLSRRKNIDAGEF